MNKQQTSSQSVEDSEQTKQNPLITFLGIVVVISTALTLFLVGYYLGVRGVKLPTFSFSYPRVTPTPVPGQIVCTMEAKICPDGSSVGRTGPSCEFAACPTASVTTPRTTPIVVPNPSGKTYISEALGVSFYYGTKMLGGNEGIGVKEIGNKIYVYPLTFAPEKGQSVEMFEKSSSDTLTQAIEKKFLVGISKTDCFVQVGAKKPDVNIETATIGYPVPENATEPAFTFGDKCPENYRSTNGMAYFWFNKQYPSKFFYFSIGQYGIPSHDGDENGMWQDTFVVLK